MAEEYGNALPGGMWALADEEPEALPATRSEAIRVACEDRPPEVRLLAEIVALAVEDLEVIEAARGTTVEISDVLRLNAVSAATFFMKGVGSAYLKAIGLERVTKSLQQRSIAVLGALGSGWSHLATLRSDQADQRMAEALNIARRPIERMTAPLSARQGMQNRLVMSLF